MEPESEFRERTSSKLKWPVMALEVVRRVVLREDQLGRVMGEDLVTNVVDLMFGF